MSLAENAGLSLYRRVFRKREYLVAKARFNLANCKCSCRQGLDKQPLQRRLVSRPVGVRPGEESEYK